MTSVISDKRKGLIEKILRFTPYILAVILWCLLAFKEQYYLKKVEDLSVFLFDKLFILEWFKTPGGFLGLAGMFLTQFLHLPWLGALLWVVLLLIAYQFTVRVFNIPESYRPLALIAPVLLVIANMSLGYGVFIMREQDHFLGPLLGYLVSLIPMTVIPRIRHKWAKALFIPVWGAAGFELFGTFALIGLLVTALASLVRPQATRKERFTEFLCLVACIIFIPIFMYPAYTTYRMADSWIMGLPSISDDRWTHAMRAPIQLALLCPLILGLIQYRLQQKPLEDNKKYLTNAILYIVSVAAVWGFWFKDPNFHTELAMSDAVDSFDWKKAIRIYHDASRSQGQSFEPTRSMVMYRDLALLKTNQALDKAFTMKDGSKMQKSRTVIPMAWQSGKQIYLQYGLVNMSYRWCLEDVIEHGWSYGTLKYMVMHSVVMHEEEFARKYINKLSKTLFYRKWAKGQTALAHDSTLMASTKPYSEILPYMCFENRMTNDMVKTEGFMMRHYTEAIPTNPTPEFDRAALFWAMRIQNIQVFWSCLYDYAQTNKVEQLPRAVEEAAILYSSLEKPPFELRFSKNTTDRYNAFRRFVENNPVRDIKESSEKYYSKFGDTFFYYYYFIRDLKTY